MPTYCDQGPPPGGLSLYDGPMSTTPTIADLLAMPEAADTADLLHAALTAACARGSVRVRDSGQWVVRLMRGLPRHGYAFPPVGQDRDEWLAAMIDRLEAVAGVRPELELED